MFVFRVTLGPIVKEACPVGSCPATMEVAVLLQRGGLVVPALQVMVAPSVSTAVMRAALRSPVGMEGCALKRPASHTFTVSVPVILLVNAVSRAVESPTYCPHALEQTVIAKPTTVYVTRSATRTFAAGMAVTAL